MTNNEEENKRRIKKLLDSEADTRAETPIEPKVDEQGTTKASAAKKTPPPLDPADTLLLGGEYAEPRHIPLDENNMPLPRPSRMNVQVVQEARPRRGESRRRVNRAKPHPHPLIGIPSIGNQSTGKKRADALLASLCWGCLELLSSPSSADRR